MMDVRLLIRLNSSTPSVSMSVGWSCGRRVAKREAIQAAGAKDGLLRSEPGEVIAVSDHGAAASMSKAASLTCEHSPPEGKEGECEAGEVRPALAGSA
jgi:hypothetical protein